jgi:hypothetical protein
VAGVELAEWVEDVENGVVRVLLGFHALSNEI